MKAIKFDSVTGYLRPPKDYDEEKNGPCGDLPIMRDEEANTITSIWLPSVQELKELNAGGGVALIVAGKTHPPLMLTTCVVTKDSVEKAKKEANRDIDGVLHDWKRHLDPGTERFYYTGYISNNTKEGLSDGEFLKTSLIVSGPNELGVITTLNSAYLLGPPIVQE